MRRIWCTEEALMAGKVAAAREALECDLEELQRGYQEQVSWRGGWALLPPMHWCAT